DGPGGGTRSTPPSEKTSDPPTPAPNGRSWPADAIERWPVARLVPYARNARTHSPAQVAEIAGSIREWGWTTPALIDETGGIIAGHGRVLAAHKLGITEIPVMIARGWSQAQKQAYTLADNKLMLNGSWDLEKLRVELTDLRNQAVDLATLGFGEHEVNDLLGHRGGLTDPNAVPELPVNPIARIGDIWLLGRHRLVCGDCTRIEAIDAALNGTKPHLCLTDPPYGLESTVSKKNKYVLSNDSPERLHQLIAEFLPLARNVAPLVVLTPGNGNQRLYPTPTWTMAWCTPAGIGRGPWGFCCWQPIMCFGKDPKLAMRKGCRPDATVTDDWVEHPETVIYADAIIHTERAPRTAHPCAKPINFWSWLLERVSERGQLIFDPFIGSGTTTIAAEMTGRVCHAIEISPAYCDVTIQRWQAFTGQPATRLSDGETYASVSNGRTSTKADRAA
ncbi:MAG TPA: DNA methyltransferase, partial [Xanthobacteraceae bacterium]|nr:DNA methyltransferase [Xanthobacteraceae bacterium]